MSQAIILIVDGEVDLKNVIKTGLEMSGFSVKKECDPVEALENFRAGAHALVISDIRMPQMDGFELYERLSRVDPDRKICFFTAFDVEYRNEYRSKFPHLDTKCFMKKPISIATMVKMIKAELGLD